MCRSLQTPDMNHYPHIVAIFAYMFKMKNCIQFNSITTECEYEYGNCDLSMNRNAILCCVYLLMCSSIQNAIVKRVTLFLVLIDNRYLHWVAHYIWKSIFLRKSNATLTHMSFQIMQKLNAHKYHCVM